MAEFEVGEWIEELLHIHHSYEWALIGLGIVIPPAIVASVEEVLWAAVRETVPLTIAIILIVNLVFSRVVKGVFAKVCCAGVILIAAALIALALGAKAPDVSGIFSRDLLAAHGNWILAPFLIVIDSIIGYSQIYGPLAFWISVLMGASLGLYLSLKSSRA
jgi:hypothetical protein